MDSKLFIDSCNTIGQFMVATKDSLDQVTSQTKALVEGYFGSSVPPNTTGLSHMSHHVWQGYNFYMMYNVINRYSSKKYDLEDERTVFYRTAFEHRVKQSTLFLHMFSIQMIQTAVFFSQVLPATAPVCGTIITLNILLNMFLYVYPKIKDQLGTPHAEQVFVLSPGVVIKQNLPSNWYLVNKACMAVHHMRNVLETIATYKKAIFCLSALSYVSTVALSFLLGNYVNFAIGCTFLSSILLSHLGKRRSPVQIILQKLRPILPLIHTLALINEICLMQQLYTLRIMFIMIERKR